jgi:hypothetical protein
MDISFAYEGAVQLDIRGFSLWKTIQGYRKRWMGFETAIT